jgi:hypothetical protein
MLGRRLSMMRIMAMRTKAVASSRSNERQNIRSLLPYCFHASGAWKQSLSLQGKLQLLQYITGALTTGTLYRYTAHLSRVHPIETEERWST